mgnify:CR=1 FL=1
MTTDIAKEFRKGQDLRENGDYEGALKIFQEIASSVGTTVALDCVIGFCHRNLGEYDLALKHFTRAVELAPRAPAASLGLFHTLLEAEMESQALAEARRFKELTGSQEFAEILSAFEANDDR